MYPVFRLSPVVPLLLALLLGACTNDPGFEESAVEMTTLDLPPLAASEGHYEVWFSYPDDPVADKVNATAHSTSEYVSMGTFIVNDDGSVAGVDGGSPSIAVPAGYDPNLLIDAIVTIEGPGDNDETPGAIFLAAPFRGDDNEGTALLKISGSDAFGNAFDTTAQTGSIRLTTPSTSDMSEADEVMGVWFLDSLYLPSLGLKTLPVTDENDEWIYESWLTGSQGGVIEYISLGRFLSAGDIDENGAGPNAGPRTITVGAPGEDFVTGTTRTLNDGTYGVVVSLQPKTVSTGRPFHSLLSIGTIPQSTTRDSSILLALVPGTPEVDLKVER